MTRPFLDYSTYKDFSFCELKWVEKFLHKTRKPRKEGQQDDALTLGTLVHAGLQHLREAGFVEIPEDAITESNPTPECVAWARQLVLGYHRTYPTEPFTYQRCEHAIRFPLHFGMDGLAKVDRYFHLDHQMQLEDGLGGEFTLNPGVYVHEYKTKDASKDIGRYMLGWRMNMQPCFQMLALQHLLGEPVQGVFVNVLEKPKEYKPTHTCKACKAKNERRDWEPTGAGYKCPSCNEIQKLDVSDKSKVQRVPTYYRLAVHKTQLQLAQARSEMEYTANRMLQLSQPDQPFYPAQRATERCVDPIWGACEYFEAHDLGLAASAIGGFVQIEPYGYVKEEPAA